LKSAFPNIYPEFIFKGQLLNERNTIEFYRLKSNDSIVAIPGHSDPCLAQRWITITRDCDAFSDSIKLLINPGARRELLRLLDMRTARIERPRRTFGRIVAEKVCADRSVAGISRDTMNVVTDKADMISADPLPVCW
jgi:hypothetical protein